MTNKDFMDRTLDNQTRSKTVLEEPVDQDESYEDTASNGILTDDARKAIEQPFEGKRSYPLSRSEIYND